VRLQIRIRGDAKPRGMEAIVQARAFRRSGHDGEGCYTEPVELLGAERELAHLTATKRAIQTAEQREEY
jgi:hypothetical protein